METFNGVRSVALIVSVGAVLFAVAFLLIVVLISFSTRGARTRKRLAAARELRAAQIAAADLDRQWSAAELVELSADDPDFDDAWKRAHAPEGFSHPSRG